MNEISTDYKANSKLSSWIKRQLQAVAKYVPRKGGICNLCGDFCRTYKTDSETGVRYHRCNNCGINFKTSEIRRQATPRQQQQEQPAPPETHEPQKQPVSPAKVGSIPTKQDKPTGKKVKVGNSKKHKGK